MHPASLGTALGVPEGQQKDWTDQQKKGIALPGGGPIPLEQGINHSSGPTAGALQAGEGMKKARWAQKINPNAHPQ